MADGMWTMTDEGEFVLEESYAAELQAARAAATLAWTNAIVDYLAQRCPYTAEELLASLLTRCQEGDEPNAIVDEFVLEALSGDL